MRMVSALSQNESFSGTGPRSSPARRQWRKVGGIATLILVSVLPATGQQQQPFTLRVDTQLVVEAVTVKDKDGRPIEGLTERDFTITEDGVRQTISVFDFQRLDNTPLPPLQPQSILQLDKAS